jgi:hypothetical protein
LRRKSIVNSARFDLQGFSWCANANIIQVLGLASPRDNTVSQKNGEHERMHGCGDNARREVENFGSVLVRVMILRTSRTRLLCIPDLVLVRRFLQNIIRYTDEGNIQNILFDPTIDQRC